MWGPKIFDLSFVSKTFSRCSQSEDIVALVWSPIRTLTLKMRQTISLILAAAAYPCLIPLEEQ
ncbi:hypothetical protein Spb1_08130 [Planctopirus ephydatiae]|jgi:hypothetical protein|uniref:Uncharacterized protein n=1 Tax=Planctopirus ephydatiae TaxID=2528019 RepID=A0A518GK32_9PLAN|nr:hypothetical protein Spb1_08130 [Planctopirus ephydatiae]